MAVTACQPPSRTSHAGILLVLTTALVMLAALLAGQGQARATTACSLYAAPGGSDGAPGTLTQPFASVQRLADTLTAGQTGCVRAGAYTQNVTITHAGNPSAPITITSYPGERATLTGRLWIHEGADYVTISNMNLNGRNIGNLPSPDINAAHTTFTANDVTDEHTAICFDIGSDTSYGRATETVIQGNRIHDCGELPAANHDHGIYVESSTGARILENVIYDNADRGIQLYPDAQQTTIEHNIIDSNGEGIIFSGDFGTASSENTITNNLITNSTLREDIESWYPVGNPIGQANTVQHNCVWGGVKGTIQTPETGFTATNNTATNPQYANPQAGDYRINSTSPCANLLTNTNTPTQPFNNTNNNTITYTNNNSSGSSGEATTTTSSSGITSSGTTSGSTTSSGTTSPSETTSTRKTGSSETKAKRHHSRTRATVSSARSSVRHHRHRGHKAKRTTRRRSVRH
jgi:parallel beta-helix repeat protein